MLWTYLKLKMAGDELQDNELTIRSEAVGREKITNSKVFSIDFL